MLKKLSFHINMIRWITFMFIVGILPSESLGQRSSVLPDFATVQYAGSIGFVNAGIGYQLSGKSSLSFHYGYVPKNRGGELNIVAGKLLYNAYTIRFSDKIRLDPFQPGLMLSYHFGSEFRSRWPSYRYPDGYYWWKSSLRAHLLTQSSLTLDLKDKTFQSITVYVEFNTNDLYFISYVKNRHSLTLGDIIKVGYGLRANF